MKISAGDKVSEALGTKQGARIPVVRGLIVFRAC